MSCEEEHVWGEFLLGVRTCDDCFAVEFDPAISLEWEKEGLEEDE